MPEDQADDPPRSPARARWSRFVRHPASLLVWFTLLSVTVREQYPFSHFPMYSSWGSRTHYFYIRADDGPIQAKSVFGVSVPRMKKLYGGIIKDIEEERGKSYGELAEADFSEAGRRLLQQLRVEAAAKRREKFGEIMDRDLTLVRVDIGREGTEFQKIESDVVTTAGDNRIPPPGGGES